MITLLLRVLPIGPLLWIVGVGLLLQSLGVDVVGLALEYLAELLMERFGW